MHHADVARVGQPDPVRGRDGDLAGLHQSQWDEATSEVRWMCSWDTTAAEVDEFAADIAAVLTDSPTGSTD